MLRPWFAFRNPDCAADIELWLEGKTTSSKVLSQRNCTPFLQPMDATFAVPSERCLTTTASTPVTSTRAQIEAAESFRKRRPMPGSRGWSPVRETTSSPSRIMTA